MSDNNFDFLFGGKPNVEPTADLRTAARSMFQVYTAFLDAGFDAAQALQLTAVLLAKS